MDPKSFLLLAVFINILIIDIAFIALCFVKMWPDVKHKIAHLRNRKIQMVEGSQTSVSNASTIAKKEIISVDNVVFETE